MHIPGGLASVGLKNIISTETLYSSTVLLEENNYTIEYFLYMLFFIRLIFGRKNSLTSLKSTTLTINYKLFSNCSIFDIVCSNNKPQICT